MFGFLDETSELNTQGIGLGLYITKMVVGAFDGDVSVNSTVGQGSEFSLTFKLATEDMLVGGIQRDINPRFAWNLSRLVVVSNLNSRDVLPISLSLQTH